MIRLRTLILLILTTANLPIGAIAAAVQQSQPASQHVGVPTPAPREPAATRVDLALAYLELDRALLAHPHTGEKLAAINRAFDEASLMFFANRFDEAVREVKSATASLLAETPEGRLRARFGELRALPSPQVYPLDERPQATIRIRREGVIRDGFHGRMPVKLQVVDGQNRILGEAERAIEPVPDAWTDWSFPIALDEGAVPGVCSIRLIAPDGSSLTIGRWSLVASGLGGVRRANADALKQIAAENRTRAQAIACCAARNRLLVDDPSATSSAQFLADPARLALEVAVEIEALKRGDDPYVERDGDTWRMLSVGEQQVPFRVHAPAKRDRATPRPLVIALHGAGGDENMFMEAYGQGVLKRLADKHEFIAASPLTYPLAGDAKLLDALIEEITNCFAIDPDRIYLVGHSLGSMAAAGLGVARKNRIAAVCCIAGGGVPRSTDIPPTLIIAAELDALAGPGAAERGANAVESVQEAGVPVEYRIMRDWGHTLVVGAALPDAIDWLLKHTRTPSPSSQPAP